MKPLNVSEDILPIGEFKTHASRILREMAESGRPRVITQNGKPAGVLISPEAYDRLVERERFVAAVNEGLAQSEAGLAVESPGDLNDLLDEKYGRTGDK